jgi:hypothetical protein
MGGVMLVRRRTVGIAGAAAFENFGLEVLRIVGIIPHDPGDLLDGATLDGYNPGKVMNAAARDIPVLAGFDDRLTRYERAVPAAGRTIHPHLSRLYIGGNNIPFELRHVVLESLKGDCIQMKDRNYGGVQRGTAHGGPQARRQRKSHSF